MLTCLVGVQIELDAFRGALLPTRSGAIAGYAIDFADFSQLTPPLAVNYQGQNGVGADWRSWTVGSDRCNFQTLCHALNGLPLIDDWMQHYVQTVLTAQKRGQPCHSLSLELQTHALQPSGLALLNGSTR